MFILVPLLLVFASLLGIAIIIWRKKSYLDKLYSLNMAGTSAGDSVSGGASFDWLSFGAELFPEIKVLLDKIMVNKYKALWLKEAEKLLRKIRLIFLRVDRVSDSLIKKIRRVHTNDKLSGHTITETIEHKPEQVHSRAEKRAMSEAFLKNEEGRLIMEIAKNPKDAKLYEALGDLYLEMENWADAKESFEAAIELNPQNESLKLKLSSALEKLTTH